jgi:branched-chain amino acid transport system substrate-binding protein
MPGGKRALTGGGGGYRRPVARRWGALALTLTVGLTTGTGVANAGEAADSLVLGSLAPETGDLAPLLRSLRVPVEMAVQEINAAGGVNGVPVTLVTGDEGTDAATARATVARFVEAGVDAIEGPATPQTVLNVLGAVKRAGILMCSGTDTLAPITRDRTGGLYFRTAPPSRLQGAALAQLVLADARRRVAVVRRDDYFGSSVERSLVRALRAEDVRIVESVSYEPDATTWRTEARRVAKKKPDAIVVIGFEQDGAGAVRSLLAPGVFATRVPIYVPDTMQSTSFATLVSGAVPQVVAGIEGTAPAPAPGGVQSPFLRAFAARGVDPIFSAHAYDCTILTALASIKAKSTEPAKMRKAFTKNLRGREDCNTFAACKLLLEQGKSIHWRGASSSFDHYGEFEPRQGVFDTWRYDAAGRVVTNDASQQIHVP